MGKNIFLNWNFWSGRLRPGSSERAQEDIDFNVDFRGIAIKFRTRNVCIFEI